MINVNQITSMLAKLPDQSLQQYAEMHKDDPYVMSLAVSESNRRKQMRAGAQAPQQQGEAPSVAEQELMAMAGPNMSPKNMARLSQRLDKQKEQEFQEFTRGAPMPEEQGIARLPAGDMNFADGGIVAFAGGGDVPRYNGSQSQFVQDLLAIPGKWDEWKRRQAEEDRLRAEEERMRLEKQQARDEAGLKQGILNYMFGSPETAEQGKAAMAALQAQDSARVAAERVGPVFTPGGESGLRPETAPASEEKAPKRVAPAEGGVADLLKKQAAPKDGAGSITDQIKALAQSKADISKEEAAGLEAIQKQYDNIYKGREERLTKREGELEGLKDQSYKLAMLQAGAAIMGSTGNLGSAIGKGITAGAIAHERGLDKVRDAQAKLDDARDRMEELQANRGEMSARELLKAKSAVKRDLNSGQEMLLKFAMDEHKVDREEAMKIMDINSRVALYNTPEKMAYAGALEQTITKDKPKGDPVKAYEMLQSSKREPVSRDAALKSWSGDMMLQQKYPNFEDYYRIAQGAPAAQFNPADQALIDKYSSKK